MLIAPGLPHTGRPFRADRKKNLHADTSAARSKRHLQLRSFDLLRRNPAAFQRAARTGEDLCFEEATGIYKRGRCLSPQYAWRCLHEPATPRRRAKIFEPAARPGPKVHS